MSTLPVVDLLTEYPHVALALGLLLRAGLAWQSELSWYEYRTLHGLRRLVFPILDRRFPVVSFVNPKNGRDDAEFLRTLDFAPRTVVKSLRRGGGSLHLLSSIKRRPSEHGDPLSRAHVVWTHDDGTQTEAFIFSNDDGSTDLYTHHETSVTDPAGHLSDAQTDGDPRGVVRAAIGDTDEEPEAILGSTRVFGPA